MWRIYIYINKLLREVNNWNTYFTPTITENHLHCGGDGVEIFGIHFLLLLLQLETLFQKCCKDQPNNE